MAKTSSSGHKLGQIIGDWYEEYFALPILQEVANNLGFYLDHRFNKRDCRGEKIIWRDLDGNDVDYDFVMELDGTNDNFGSPVAAFETFWRRGSRHSKDKARDDTGKLIPLKYTYPTVRILGVISAGDFTGPAKELVISRGVDLFYVDKANIIAAWGNCGLIVDYPDKSTEAFKSKLVRKVTSAIRKDKVLLSRINDELIRLITPATIKSYQQRLIGNIGAIPQRYFIKVQSKSNPLQFNSYNEVDIFLNSEEPDIIDFEVSQFYSYQVQYFDGDEFYRDNLNWDELKGIHDSLRNLVTKLEK